MSIVEGLKYDIEQIESALDHIYSAMNDLLDTDNTDKEYETIGNVADLLELLKDKKEDELIHERGIRCEQFI